MVMELANVRWKRTGRGLLLAGLASTVIACGDSAGTPATPASPVGVPPQPSQVPGVGPTGAGSPATQPPLAPTGNPVVVNPEFPPTGGPGAVPTPPNGAEHPWCGTLSVMRTACQTCHGADLIGGAPMPLVTYEDMMAPAPSDASKQVYQLVGTRVHDERRPMPPLSQDPLEASQISTIDAWVAAGAPNAPGGCAGIPDAPAPPATVEPEWPDECQERYEIRARGSDGGPFVVPANTELNVDISIPIPWAGQSGAVQALAIKPLSDNKRVVHHWILYANSGFVTSWSPGKPFEVFPDDVGVHMPTSGSFSLNMHYFNVNNDEAVEDTSGLEVCITRDLRPNTATTYMFAGSATVPPGGRTENVTTCNVNAAEPVHLITSSPHMHSYGVAAKFEVVRADGTVEVLHDTPFNWEDQTVTEIDTVVTTGDKVRVTCIYENNTSRTITFGDSSDAEMCFNFSRYYPRGGLSCFPDFGGGFPGGGFPGGGF